MSIEERIERNEQERYDKYYFGEKINTYCKHCANYCFGCRGLKNKDSNGMKLDCFEFDKEE